MGGLIRPAHYRDGGVECIDAMRRAMTREAFRGFCLGNAIKYAWRAGDKGPAAVDYDKARWYIRRLIEDARA